MQHLRPVSVRRQVGSADRDVPLIRLDCDYARLRERTEKIRRAVTGIRAQIQHQGGLLQIAQTLVLLKKIHSLEDCEVAAAAQTRLQRILHLAWMKTPHSRLGEPQADGQTQGFPPYPRIQAR